MTYNLKTFIILTGILATVAVGARAYTNPASPFPTDNREILSIDEGVKNQEKLSGLSVGAFQARGDAWMMQQTYLQGMVRGGFVGAPGNTVSTVKFGDSGLGTTVSVNASNDVYVGDRFQSDTLQHATSARGEVCADTTGKLILCSQ